MNNFLIFLILFLFSCGGSSNSGDSDDEDNDDDSDLEATLSSIQSNIFTPTCATSSCHASATSSGGLSLSDGDSFGELVGIESDGAAGVNRVTASDASASYIINKLEGTQATVGGGGSTMPRGGTPLTDEEIQTIRDWIDAGAEDN